MLREIFSLLTLFAFPQNSPPSYVLRRHLCTSSKDRTCLLWNVDLGVPVVRWSGHADSVGAVAASRKPGPWNSSSSSAAGGAAAFVVSGAADRTLQRWDVPCRPLAALEGAAKDSREAAAEVAAEAAAEADGKGKGGGGGTGVWTPPAPLLETARRSVRAHEQDINCVAVSPNDAVVASASQDRTIKLWKAADLELTGVLKGHKRGVWKVRLKRSLLCGHEGLLFRVLMPLVLLRERSGESHRRMTEGHSCSVLGHFAVVFQRAMTSYNSSLHC